MRRLFCAVLLYLGLSSAAFAQAQVGPANQILCNKIASLAVGTTGLTQMVGLVAGKSIFMCGWHITNTGASGTFAFSYGTGSNCGTGTTTLIPASNVTNTAPSADHIDYAVIQTTSGQALCVNPSVNTIAVLVYYSQF